MIGLQTCLPTHLQKRWNQWNPICNPICNLGLLRYWRQCDIYGQTILVGPECSSNVLFVSAQILQEAQITNWIPLVSPVLEVCWKAGLETNHLSMICRCLHLHLRVYIFMTSVNLERCFVWIFIPLYKICSKYFECQ